MSTEQQKELTKAEENTKAGFILTKGGVMIVGDELLGNKLTAILCAAIEHEDLYDHMDGLACLTLRDDNFPISGDKPCFGMAYADTNSIAINLQHCWHRACVKAHESEENLSFMGMLWVNIFSTLAHEMDHLTVANNDREMYELMRTTEEGNDELEKSGNAAGVPMMIALAKEFDIEIPDAADFGWFGVKLMDLFTGENTKDLEWVIKARKDIEEGLIYTEPENDIKITSFREFVKQAYDLNSNDEAWEQPTTAVNLTAYLDSGVVEEFKAEPVEDAKVKTVVLEADQVPDEAMTMVAAANGQFVGAGEVATEQDIVLADNAGVVQNIDETALANAAKQDKFIQTLMDAPNPQPITPAVVAGTEVVEVPLPAPVAAAQAVFAAAAATAAPPEVKTELPYTPHNLTGEVQAAVMEQVWKTLYHHVFTKCSWEQNPQTGRFAFMKAGAVLEGVNIQHILTQYGADNFIMEYDTLNANGQGGHSFAAEACQGMIRGRLTTGGLPSYQIYLNIGGQRVRRLFVPQNPEKRGANNAYSPTAELAGVGNQIAWVFRGEAPDGASFKEKCAVKLTNTAAGLVYEVF